MRTILIPTDFSDTAKNAARYGLEFAKHVGAEKIILYNGYSMPISTDTSWELVDPIDLKTNSEEAVKAARMLLLPWVEGNISVETLSDMGFFEDRITEIAAQVQADLIIMGITGGGNFERALFGSNALTTIHNTLVPVLVVPPASVWKMLTKIAWACDYHNIMETAPLNVIEQVLKLTGAELHVVHNPPVHQTPGAEAVTENMHLHAFLKDTPFQVAVLEGTDLSVAVNAYVEEKGIGWLIVIPKKHGWLAGLFSKDHTKELLFHTHVPMLCLHQ